MCDVGLPAYFNSMPCSNRRMFVLASFLNYNVKIQFELNSQLILGFCAIRGHLLCDTIDVQNTSKTQLMFRLSKLIILVKPIAASRKRKKYILTPGEGPSLESSPCVSIPISIHESFLITGTTYTGTDRSK
jgi:hypothetical protein